MSDPQFWDNQERARETIEEANKIKAWVEPFKTVSARVVELVELAELLQAEPDEELEGEWSRELVTVTRLVEDLEFRTMLQGEDDHRDAILTVHPGAGRPQRRSARGGC